MNMARVKTIVRLWLLTAGAAAAFCVGTAVGQNAPKFVPGEILVKFADGAASRSAVAANRSVGATAVETLGDSGWQRVRLPSGLTVEEAAARYRSIEGVAYAQPNFYYSLLVTPNDAQFGAAGMYGLTKISAPSAWDLTTGSSAVVVADIDTGTRLTHDDLVPNLWVNPAEIPNNGIDDDASGFIDDVYGADFFFNDGNPADEHGHGTHTAGTIGAVGNNIIGVTGINWAVKIMTIKIYDNDGYGSTSAMLVNAYNYIRMMKLRGVNIRVTNNSYGGCDEACGYDQATKDGIDAMGAAGILSVFAAGNDSRDIEAAPSFPASYTSPSILAVASSNQSDSKSGFSNWGAISVDVAAPGSGILSTTWGSNASYGTMSGTSMATPHGTGAAALLSAYNPALSPASLKATLMNTVDQLTGWTSTPIRTNGRINVDRALRNQTVCSFTPDSKLINVPTKGGVFTVNLTAPTNCDYAVKSSNSWLKVMSSDAASGSGEVTFRVTVNPTITRNGTITVGDQTITIRQSRN